MFHSGSGTRKVHHRLRTMASCLWLRSAPHSTLDGCRYRVKLFIDPGFLQVPAAPGFPLLPCRVTTASEALLCGTRYALPGRPASRPHRLSQSNRSSGHCLPDAVSVSPNMLGIGSNGGISPPSARRNAASLIRGTALQHLLETPWRGCSCRTGLSGVTFRSVCFAVGGLPDRSSFVLFCERQSGRPPGMRQAGVSPGRCPETYCPQVRIARNGQIRRERATRRPLA